MYEDLRGVMITLLQELETLCQVGLVGDEKKTALFRSFVRSCFIMAYFRTELDAPSDNPVRIDDGFSQVGSGVHLTRMRSEGASFLRGLIVLEVVVSLWVCSKDRIILKRSDIDRCSTLPSSNKPSSE